MAAYVAIFFFLLILNQSSSLVQASVETACSTAANKSPNVNYDFCVAALKADSRSSSANEQELAIIATDLSTANATSTKSTISTLLKKTQDGATKACLEDCLSMYSDLIDTLGDVTGYIKQRRYNDANIYLSAALDVPGNCEQGFEEQNVQSPLTKENNDLKELTAIGLVFTNLLG